MEREKHELQEVRRELESERRKLLSEGVNVLAWYSAAVEAAAAAEEAEHQEGKSPQKKRSWSFWRGKEEV